MPTAFTVLKHRPLRASTRLSAGQSVRLSLPLSPPGAGGGQSLPDCSGSPTAVAVPPPASGANHLLPVSLPTFLCPFHSYRKASGVALVPPAVMPLVLPRGGRSGILARGIAELCPAAASLLCLASFDVLVAICLSIFHAEPNVTAACRERQYMVVQPKKCCPV